MPSLSSPSRALRRTTLALTLRGILLSSTAVVSLASIGVHADQNGTHRYDLHAGALEDSLNGFAQAAGITLPFDPSLTQGKQAPALHGEFDVQSGLDQLLSGSGLAARRSAGGNWLIQPIPAAEGALEMDPLTISGLSPGSVTEGTGSYTTGSSSTATKLNLSLRETPQSVSVVTRQQMDDQNMQSLEDVARAATGISTAKDFGTERSRYFSRGFQVKDLQYDGVPTSISESYSMDVTSVNNMAIYDRVEFVRGANGLMQGLATLGSHQPGA